MRWLSSCIASLLLAPLFAPEVTAQATVLEGVYSNSQAQRGSRTYRNVCAHCHEGGEPDADPLFGSEFIDRWREAPLSYLHDFFSTRMPADEPGTLRAEAYLETLAFLLRENGYPPGNEALSEENLAAILLTGPEGPQPLPPNSLVSLVGCLAAVPDSDEHTLHDAGTPTRVRTADEIAAAELTAATASEPGTANYRLRNAARFDADALLGQKVLAKGVFNPQGSQPDLNVLSLAGTGLVCD